MCRHFNWSQICITESLLTFALSVAISRYYVCILSRHIQDPGSGSYHWYVSVVLTSHQPSQPTIPWRDRRDQSNRPASSRSITLDPLDVIDGIDGIDGNFFNWKTAGRAAADEAQMEKSQNLSKQSEKPLRYGAFDLRIWGSHSWAYCLGVTWEPQILKSIAR